MHIWLINKSKINYLKFFFNIISNNVLGNRILSRWFARKFPESKLDCWGERGRDGTKFEVRGEKRLVGRHGNRGLQGKIPGYESGSGKHEVHRFATRGLPEDEKVVPGVWHVRKHERGLKKTELSIFQTILFTTNKYLINSVFY